MKNIYFIRLADALFRVLSSIGLPIFLCIMIICMTIIIFERRKKKMEDEKKPLFQCIFMLKGMFRNVVTADSIMDLYERLSGTSVVEETDLSAMTDGEILKSIYDQSVRTTGRLTVYKLNDKYDEDDIADFDDDEYIVCREL